MSFFPRFGAFRASKNTKNNWKIHYVSAGFVAGGSPFWENKPFFGLYIHKGALLEHFFFEPCLENVAKHGGEMVAPNFCQNPTRENAGFFFLKKVLISGEKTRFSKKIRAGAMPLSKFRGHGLTVIWITVISVAISTLPSADLWLRFRCRSAISNRAIFCCDLKSLRFHKIFHSRPAKTPLEIAKDSTADAH